MTDDSRPAGDPRNDDEAPHTAVPVGSDDLGGDRSGTEPLPGQESGYDERGAAHPIAASPVTSEPQENGEPEFLRDDTADPAFREDGRQDSAGDQPDFLRDEPRVAAAPAVPVSAIDDADAVRTGDTATENDGSPSRPQGIAAEDDESSLPVATPANWPLPTAEPAWPTDDDVVTASDLEAAEVPPAEHGADRDGDADRVDERPAAATTERDSLDDLADAEGPYVPGSYSSDPDTATDTDGTDRGAAVPVSTATAQYERPDGSSGETSGGSAGPVAAVVAGGAAGAAGAGASGVGASGAGAPGAQAEAPAATSQPVYLQAPVPPRKKGNRGFGIGIAAASTLAFAALYALGVGLLLSVTTPDAFGAPLLTYLATPMFWLPVIVFFVAFALLVLIIHRANWWAFVLGGIPVAILVYGSYLLARVIQQNIFELTPNQAVAVVERSSTFPDGILAGLLARELVIWAGAAISARARRVKARNAEDRAEYERKLAETPGFGPQS
jgi:hypothetical protein